MTVGERIKKVREKNGLSQNDLAKKMGISRQAVSKAENYGDSITTDKVRKYAEALNVPIAYLMGWSEKAPDGYLLTKGSETAQAITDELSKLDERKAVLVLAYLKALNGGGDDEDRKIKQ